MLSISLSAGCKEAGLQTKAPVKQPSVKYAPGEVIVKFKPEVFGEEGELVSESIKLLNAKYGLIAMEPLFRGKTSRRIYKLEFPEEVDIIGLAQEYTKDPSVVYDEPNYTIHTTN